MKLFVSSGAPFVHMPAIPPLRWILCGRLVVNARKICFERAFCRPAMMFPGAVRLRLVEQNTFVADGAIVKRRIEHARLLCNVRKACLCIMRPMRRPGQGFIERLE